MGFSWKNSINRRKKRNLIHCFFISGIHEKYNWMQIEKQ